MFDLDKFSAHTVTIDENGNCKTYSELLTFSNEIAEILPVRSLVFAFCENSIGALFGYVSFVNNQHVPLMLSSDVDRILIEDLIKRYQPSHYWVPSDIADAFYSEASHVMLEAHGYQLISTGFDQPKMHAELALLLTTSGSTGSPKLVKLSRENLISNASSIVEYLAITDSERPITSLPMNYSYGLSVINSHILVGATILLTTKSILQREFWNFFKNEGSTSFAGVPYNYQILKKLRFFKMVLPSLRYMTQAGGRLDAQLQSEFTTYAQQHGLSFIVMYGQTEATARMSYLPWGNAACKQGSIGVAIPGGRFTLIDAQGSAVTEPNMTGELIYQGANVSLGYCENRDDLKTGDENQGMLYTGDMAKFDTDGFFYIVGRKKRFIKLFGNRVNLDSAEQLVCSHFSDFECACAGEDDNMAVYITSQDADVAKEVRQYISQKMGIHFSGVQVVSIDEIPKNGSGKTQYSKLTA